MTSRATSDTSAMYAGPGTIGQRPRDSGRLRNGALVMSGLLLAGVLLRAVAYFANTALWLDEILLGRNILERPLGELLGQPLMLDQVAPRGFLLIEKLAVMAFGANELALRLFPFLAALVGLFLFRRLAERALDGMAPYIAVTLYALGIPFIKYGAEVKQYGSDATATVALLLMAMDLRERDATTLRLVLAGAFGFLVIWFSQSSVIVMAGIGLATAVAWLRTRDRSTGRLLLVTIPMWAMASLVAVVAGLRSMTPSTKAFMHDFWQLGFVPLPLDPVVGTRWLWQQMLSLFTDPTLLRYPWPGLFLAVAAIGVASLWHRRRHVALFLLGPLAVAVMAAIAQQYPFRGRLAMYLIPCVLLTVAAGGDWIRVRAARLHPAAGVVVLVALLAVPVATLVAAPPPYEIEHHRAILGHLQQHRRAGDVVYVAPLRRIGTLFYGPRYGLGPDEWITGICDRRDSRAYLRDVDRFRGTPRFWVISTGARPFRLTTPDVRRYLGAIGVRRDSLFRGSLSLGMAGLELYDLSDPVRLANANAATFPISPMPTDPRPGCRPWSQAPSPTVILHARQVP